MSTTESAYIAGIFEHPARKVPDKSTAQLHAEAARGALADAGLRLDDVDAYFSSADAPGLGGMTMAEYIGLRNLRYVDSTETGGSSYLFHLNHAVQAIAMNQCDVALITMAERSISLPTQGLAGVDRGRDPERRFQTLVPPLAAARYALVARRHAYEFGTTPEQLAWVRVAASHHAQYNENAVFRKPVSVRDVLDSPLVADPLHRLDCCVNTDGGGAIIVTRESIAKTLKKPLVRVAGTGTAVKHLNGGDFDLTYSGAVWSGPRAFAQAGITPADIRYASLYDSFTITVIVQLEDLGFCEKGEGGRFAQDGNLISGQGRLPFNTDGGGLCNSHPGGKGGMPKIIEAVRQCRGEAHPAVQVPTHDFVLAHGTGGSLAGYHGAATVILKAE